MKAGFAILPAAAGLWLTACSTVKVASLRDARMLPEGRHEISLEFSTLGRMERLVAERARDGHPDVGRLADTLGYLDSDQGDGANVGFSYARGLGGGWEAHGGLAVPVLRLGSWLGDVGLKKRIAEGRKTLLCGYGRVAAGYTAGDMPVSTYEGAWIEHAYRGEAQSGEIDLALIGQARRSRTGSFYAGTGPTVGIIRWTLEDLSPGPYRKGTVFLQGWKTHLGFAFEFERYEVMGEVSLNAYQHGPVAAIGFRQSWKSIRKE